jgi:hypothetical protein
LLDCEHEGRIYLEELEWNYEVVYKEPNLWGGVEGVDYDVVYGIKEVESE